MPFHTEGMPLSVAHYGFDSDADRLDCAARFAARHELLARCRRYQGCVELDAGLFQHPGSPFSRLMKYFPILSTKQRV